MPSYAQNSLQNDEKIRLSMEYRKKSDYILQNNNWWSKIYMHEGENYYQFSLGYKFYKSFVVELGFFKETYNLGFSALEDADGSAIGSYPIETGKVFPFRVSYEQRICRVFKRPVYLTPSLGYSMGFAQGTLLTDSSSTFSINYTTGDFAIGTFKKGSEYDVNARFGFLEARLQAEVMVSNAFSFYAGAGINRGTHILGRTNVTEFSGGVPIKKIINETRGDNRYFNIGIRLRVPNFWKKATSKI